MEDGFSKLLEQQKNNVDNLVKWMQDAKLVEKTEEGKKAAIVMFNHVQDKSNVTLEQFKVVLDQVAKDGQKNLGEVMNSLSGTANELIKIIQEAASKASAAVSGK